MTPAEQVVGGGGERVQVGLGGSKRKSDEKEDKDKKKKKKGVSSGVPLGVTNRPQVYKGVKEPGQISVCAECGKKFTVTKVRSLSSFWVGGVVRTDGLIWGMVSILRETL